MREVEKERRNEEMEGKYDKKYDKKVLGKKEEDEKASDK